MDCDVALYYITFNNFESLKTFILADAHSTSGFCKMLPDIPLPQ